MLHLNIEAENFKGSPLKQNLKVSRICCLKEHCLIGLERRRSANERWQNWKEAEIGSDQLKDRGSGVRRLKRLRPGTSLQPATCPPPQLLPLISHLKAQLNTDAALMLFFSFLKVTIYQHELYRVSHPKQVVNRILRTVLCNQIFGPMSTKTAQISQNCLYNLDGLKWSKDLFSQNIFKIMLANIFGHPAAKTLARWR